MAKTQIILSNRQLALKLLDRKLKKLNDDHSRKYFILTDENVLEHCMPTLICNVTELEEADFLELPSGEACKEAEIVTEVWKSLIASNADRNAIIVNLGGGCVCDVGGFIASTYKRGIDFVNVPTTLTAMVDAAIGGKTAINLDGAKNQIGCFRNPIITCIEPAFLETLPENELRSGEYEIMKSLILNGSGIDSFPSGNVPDYTPLIKECVDFKLSVVKADLLDKDLRKILNFGHTFGHALESYYLSLNTPRTHGECVGIGMLYALYLSHKKLGLSRNTFLLYRTWLSSRMAIPHFSLKEVEPILQFMHLDKKNCDEAVLCVLLQDIGVPVIDVAVSDNEICDTLLSAAKI